MTMDRARFDQGLTYDAFKGQMTRNRDNFEANEQQVDLSKADLAAFRALPRPVKVVVLAEDWCGDVIANLPVLGRLAKDSGKLEVRIFLRDQNDDIMQGYLNKGQFKSIPVFVFFDDAFRELGHWIERPASVTEIRAKRRKDIFAAHPEFVQPESAAKMGTRLYTGLQQAFKDAGWSNAAALSTEAKLETFRAIAEQRAALNLKPDDSTLLVDLGRIYMKAGRAPDGDAVEYRNRPGRPRDLVSTNQPRNASPSPPNTAP